MSRVWMLVLVGCTAPGHKSEDSAGVPVDNDPVTVVTFNTGTTPAMGPMGGDEDGYGPAEAAISDEWYGDGLAWLPAVEAARVWLDGVRPDVLGVQEMFWSGTCGDIPTEAHTGFYCEGWSEGDNTVIQAILDADYQIACHQGKPDKCVAIHRDLGTLEGCADDLCMDGLQGETVDGCGQGGRVGRGVVLRPDGRRLTLVHVHGSSGWAPEDQACRVAQIAQVFDDLGGDGPAAQGDDVLILGDLNTDPGRATASDESAARWAEAVGPGQAFQWITDVGPDAPASYQGIADIDHVASNAREGDCWIAGIAGQPEVYDVAYFDHRPVVCATTLRPVLQ